MALLPELAPKRQNHLLGSTSVVRSVAYARNRVTYTTFAAAATEVLRLRFRPVRVVGGTYTVEPAGGGDYIVRVRHDGAQARHDRGSPAALAPGGFLCGRAALARR